MRAIASDQIADFAAIYEDDVELVSISRPDTRQCEALSQKLIESRQLPQLRWVQKAGDPDALAKELPASIDPEVHDNLVEQIVEASDVVGELMGCKEVGIRLETLSAPMCPRFHVDYVPCRMLITLSGTGTEWIPSEEVDWPSFKNLDNTDPPLKSAGEIRHMDTGNWSLLKGGAWNDQYVGIVHRSPHQRGERLLLSMDPIV